MFYYLYELRDTFGPLNIFQYITVRAFGASATAFVLSLLLGPSMIRALRSFKIGQQVRSQAEVAELYALHGKKAGTPTMGGLLIIVCTVVATLLWAVPLNGFILIAVSTFVYMGLVGFGDDYLKVTRKQSKGLSARSKLLLQGGWALLIAIVLLKWNMTQTHARELMVPFLKEPIIHNMGIIGCFVLVVLVLLGCTNAVNLTDGLDGLAIGCSNSVFVAYLMMSYVAGHFAFADYLHVPFIAGCGELTVFCAALLGAGLGFLWFNCYPAQVFMGDTGSLALGGAMAIVAVLINQEITLFFVGGVFVLEALSVVIQIGWFKWSGGKRVFRCAPIHHHFELLMKERIEKAGLTVGNVETMITTRLWIASIVFALLGVATLKIR